MRKELGQVEREKKTKTTTKVSTTKNVIAFFYHFFSLDSLNSVEPMTLVRVT